MRSHLRLKPTKQRGGAYLRSELCECSEPEYWQLLHHDSSSKSTSEDDDSPRDVHEDLAPALHGYADAREGALARAYEGLHEAEARSDQVAIKIVTMMQSTC